MTWCMFRGRNHREALADWIQICQPSEESCEASNGLAYQWMSHPKDC